MTNEKRPNASTRTGESPRSQGEAGDLARGDPETLAKFNGRTGGGDSAGGAYPNPHTGKEGSDKDGYSGTGGQTEVGYHGTNKLGEQDLGPNPNSPTEGNDYEDS